MSRLIAPASLIIAFVLAVCMVLQTARMLKDNRFPRTAPYDPDYLTPAALYEDLVVDNYSLRGFKFSAATFAFPDVTTYFATRAIVGETSRAVIVWEGVLFAVLVGSAWTGAVGLTPRRARPYMLPAILCCATFYVGYNARQFFTTASVDLLLPVSHTGAQACGFLGLFLTALALRASGWCRIGHLAMLTSLSFVATFSDRLFGLYFAAPLVLTLAAIWLASRLTRGTSSTITWRGVAAVSFAVAMGCGAAAGLLKALQGPASDPMKHYWTEVMGNGLPARAQALGWDLIEEAASGNVLVLSAFGWYALCVLSATIGIARCVRGGYRPSGDGLGFEFYQLFTVAMLAVVVGVFLLSAIGVQVLDSGVSWRGYSRYFAGPFAASLFGWGMAFARAATMDRIALRAAGLFAPFALAAVGLGATACLPLHADYDLSDLRPNEVRLLDEECEKAGVRVGVAGYWQAKPLTLLSRKGVRVRQVAPDQSAAYGFKPHHWLSNAEWYWKAPADTDPEVRYQFALTANEPWTLDQSRTADVVAIFGEPASRIPIGPYVMLVYNRPQDGKFRRFGELSSHVLELRYQTDPKSGIRLPGNALYPTDHKWGDGLERVADEGKTAPGVLAFGPYFHPQVVGRHRATFRLTSSGASQNGVIDVMYDDPVTNTHHVLGTTDIPAGFDGEIPIEFDVLRHMRRGLLQTRVVYTGQGRLVLHWVDLKPCP